MATTPILGSSTGIAKPSPTQSSIKSYGQGDFMVGFFGRSAKFSKDGQQFQEFPEYYNYKKGKPIFLSDYNLNDNSKTFNFYDSPSYIDSVNIQYTATATASNRSIKFKISTDEDFEYWINAAHSSNSWRKYLLHSNHNSYSQLNYSAEFALTLPLPEIVTASLRFYDVSNIDVNDDLLIQISGFLASPIHKWITLKNCKELQIENHEQTLGVGSNFDKTPSDIKVLRI